MLPSARRWFRSGSAGGLSSRRGITATRSRATMRRRRVTSRRGSRRSRRTCFSTRRRRRGSSATTGATRSRSRCRRSFPSCCSKARTASRSGSRRRSCRTISTTSAARRSITSRGKTSASSPTSRPAARADFSEYNDGERGGKVKVRAKIEVRSKYLLAVTELPYGVTTESLIESDPRGECEGEDQGQARGRQHGGQGRDSHPSAAGRGAGEGHPAALRLHELPGAAQSRRVRDRPQSRDRRRQAALPRRARHPQGQRRGDQGAAEARTGDQARRTRAAVALGFAGAHFHRGAHLPEHREIEDVGERARGNPQGAEAVHQDSSAARSPRRTSSASPKSASNASPPTTASRPTRR